MMMYIIDHYRRRYKDLFINIQQFQYSSKVHTTPPVQLWRGTGTANLKLSWLSIDYCSLHGIKAEITEPETRRHSFLLGRYIVLRLQRGVYFLDTGGTGSTYEGSEKLQVIEVVSVPTTDLPSTSQYPTLLWNDQTLSQDLWNGRHYFRCGERSI